MATPNSLKTEAGNGLGPRTQIISMPTADQDAMDAQIAELGLTHSIAGIDGAAGGTVIVAVQGTADAPATLTGGTITVTDIADFS
jgi:hypothetical protein